MHFLGEDIPRARDLDSGERWAFGLLLAIRAFLFELFHYFVVSLFDQTLVMAGMVKAYSTLASHAIIFFGLFVASAFCWRKAKFPFAPAEWQSGRRAKLCILAVLAYSIFAAFMPLDVKFGLPIILAIYEYYR